MKRFVILLCVVAVVGLCVQATSLGSVTVNWSTGDAYAQDVGNNGLFGPNYPGNTVNTDDDKVTLTGQSGSLTLDLMAPQTVAIEALAFEVGQTGYEGTDKSYWLETVFSMTVNMTVNGVTNALTIPMTHHSGWYADDLQANPGNPVAFGDIIVTPLGWASPDTNDGRTSYDTVYAQVEAVPEPTTIIVWNLLGVAAAGYGAWRRRRAD
jgi:hypothetical protein